MKATRVIPYKSLPARVPTISSIVMWLFLDRLGAPGWVYGIVGTIFAIFWIFEIYKIFTQDQSADPAFVEKT